MITVDAYWMDRDRTHRADLTADIIANAQIVVERTNALLACFGEDRAVSSGWRPPSVNAGVPGAAKGSKHMAGTAIDLQDRDERLDQWCMEHLDVLREIGLWLEHPGWTVGWSHLQIVPPRSGARVFVPSTAEPVTLAYGRASIHDSWSLA